MNRKLKKVLGFIFALVTIIIVIQLKNTINYNNGSRSVTQWRSETFNYDVVSDMTDWSFRKRITCPKFTARGFPRARQMIALQCDSSVEIVTKISNSSKDIFEIPFGDKCLIDVINKYCTEGNRVPNIVHYVWYSKTSMDFLHFLSFISVIKFVSPCLILIHGPYLPYGLYWEYFVRVYPRIIHVKRKPPRKAGSRFLAFPEHGSDMMRIEALQVYGGLYLDWDEVILKPVDKFRDYDITMGVESPQTKDAPGVMASQFVMAKKSATFLNLWYNSYLKNYKPSWGYNALLIPYWISKQQPNLINVVGDLFTRPGWSQRYFIFFRNVNWSENYAMHLYKRDYKDIIDEQTIRKKNTTIGSISRHVLLGNKELCLS